QAPSRRGGSGASRRVTPARGPRERLPRRNLRKILDATCEKYWTLPPGRTWDVAAPVGCDHRQQHPPPVFGTGPVASAQHDLLQVAELVEQEEGVVTGTAEMAVIGGALLVAIGLAHRPVHVQDKLREP